MGWVEALIREETLIKRDTVILSRVQNPLCFSCVSVYDIFGPVGLSLKSRTLKSVYSYIGKCHQTSPTGQRSVRAVSLY